MTLLALAALGIFAAGFLAGHWWRNRTTSRMVAALQARFEHRLAVNQEEAQRLYRRCVGSLERENDELRCELQRRRGDVARVDARQAKGWLPEVIDGGRQ